METLGPTREPETGNVLDWADPADLPIEEVRDVFVTLSKALRAYQLYDSNNPVYKRFVSNLRDALFRIWGIRDQLQILVEEDRFTWLGEEVYHNDNRTDSLSFIFYRDGVRDLTLMKGIEESELELFLDAMHRAKNARQDGDDLVTILWDLDLQLLSYSAIDLAAEGGEYAIGTGVPGVLNGAAILAGEVGGRSSPQVEDLPEGVEEDDDGVEEASGSSGGAPTELAGMWKDEFNPTLYALDESERRYLKEELRKEEERDLRGDVLSALFDRLEEEYWPGRQEEILGVLRTLLPNFLSRGAFASAAQVVRELSEMQQKRVFSPEAANLVERLFDDLSAREAVDEIVRALEDGTVIPEARELMELFRHLRPVALGSLLKGAEETQLDRIREVLRRAVLGIATGNRDVVIRLITSPDVSIASGAIRLAGSLGITEASGALARILDQGTLELRKVVLETAAEMPSSALAGALQRLLKDSDRELRVGAARVLGKSKYAPAAQELRRILEEKDFRLADVTEKIAFFEAYGLLAGESSVGFLDKILNGKGFLGKREPAELRAGAALGLGKARTASARQALETAKREEDPIVRSAVSRALKGDDHGDG